MGSLVPSAAPLVFRDDDRGYLSWLAGHPSGFVMNCAPQPTADYVVLHRASCGSLVRRPGDRRGWTSAYIKVCADSRAPIEDWCRTRTGADPHPCGLCDP